ncbi:MAG: hypothetical protein J2P54_00935 [Bradyrhizobiaceae bacterium]|nr:hypothetical protein [Bradyrhizobiaceae bacterium]
MAKSRTGSRSTPATCSMATPPTPSACACAHLPDLPPGRAIVRIRVDKDRQPRELFLADAAAALLLRALCHTESELAVGIDLGTRLDAALRRVAAPGGTTSLPSSTCRPTVASPKARRCRRARS